MIPALLNYSDSIKKAVWESILPKVSALNITQRKQLFDVFCYYVPNKERAFILNQIAGSYGIDKDLSFLLETGLELIFAAYYLRDDLLDNAQTILGEEVNDSTAKRFALLADMLNEIGNIQIAEYCTRLDVSSGTLDTIFNGFLLLSYGQLQGLENNGNTKDYIKIAYNKNGAMMEYAVRMLLPLLPTFDGKLLVNFATDFGVASQIRNDIEDFLRKDTNSLFHDLKEEQANFVLSAYYDRTGTVFKPGLNDADVYEILTPDICFSIKFLYAFKDRMLDGLEGLQNSQCKDYLKDITKNIITFE